MRRWLWLAYLLGACALLGLEAWYASMLMLHIGIVSRPEKPAYLMFFGLMTVVYLVAMPLLLRLSHRQATAVVLLGGILLSGMMFLHRPVTSTDSARYNWDGMVQDAGISPYRYTPLDPALEHLRPTWLFFEGQYRADGSLRCPVERTFPVTQADGTQLCTAINRVTVPTIYPPVAEALFAAARAGVPSTVQYLPMQIMGLLAVLATTLLLLRITRQRGIRPGWVAVWSWCPLVALEGVNNAHIDAVAVALALAATLLVTNGRPRSGGIVLGLAIATKFTPLLIAPPLLRRSPLRIGLVALGAVIAVYLPHLFTVGAQVFGYLPGYLNEEGYDDGSRSALLSAVLPGGIATLVAAALLAVITAHVSWHAVTKNPWVAQTVIVGSALLLLSPKYSWYALLLLPFMILSRRFEWAPLAIVLQVRQIGLPHLSDFQLLLLGCLLIVLIANLSRWWFNRRVLTSAGYPPVSG